MSEHNHATVQRFGFLRHISAPGYDVNDDDGEFLGVVVRSNAGGWIAYLDGALLSTHEGTIRRPRRRDAAYELLHAAKGCSR